MATTRMTHPYHGPQILPGDGAMARRKGVLTHRVAVGVLIVVCLGLVMSSRVFLTSQITGQRARIANLESRKEFLEAGQADLHSRWIAASAPAVVMARARKELGLVAADTPGPVLVLVPGHEDERDRLAILRSEVEHVFHGTMVSLQPRVAHADPAPNRGQ